VGLNKEQMMKEYVALDHELSLLRGDSAMTQSTSQPTLTLVIPFFNEEESLSELYSSIKEVMEANDYTYELVFVDDGSTDQSAHVAQEFVKSDGAVKLIKFRRNFGKAAALQAGFKICHSEYVVTMDADLQDDPNEIPRLIGKLQEGYDVVSGWKLNRLDPLEKRLPSKLFNKVTSSLSGVKLHDFNCGFKAYRRIVIETIDVYGELHRYIPVLASRYGFRIAEIPVYHKARKHGKSKYGIERYLRGLFDSISVTFVSRYSTKPMYIFGRVGLFLSLAGFIICAYLAVIHFMGEVVGQRPLLLLGVLCLILGVQFFSFGLIGDMLTNISFRRNYSDAHILEIFSNTNVDLQKSDDTHLRA
jgi:glycosyltransferase involved in cell wall biosynthesis